MQRMPEKDPYTWAAVWAAIPEPMRAALLSSAVALLRILYDRKESRPIRVAIESALCGCLSLAVFHGVQALQWSQYLGVFLGGVIGLVGVDQVRSWARAFGNRKLAEEAENEPR